MLFYIATQPPAEAVAITTNQSQSIGDLFTSDQLYRDLYGLTAGQSPQSSSSLTLSLTSVDFGFNPAENGSLQWLNPDSSQPAWANVVTTEAATTDIPATSIPIRTDVDLRFIPTAEASQLASDSHPLTVAVAASTGVTPTAVSDPIGSIGLQIPHGAAYSYATGQAIGLNEVNADIGGNLTVQVPVRAGIGVSSAGVSDNAVALLDATNIGGVLGVSPIGTGADTTLKSAANLQVLADVSGLVSASAHTSADSVADYADADAQSRFGIKSPPGATSPADKAQGGFGILNMDLVAGADANVRGTTAIQLDTSTDSTSGRARSTTEVGDVAGVGDSAVQAAADLNLTGIAGIGLHTGAHSAMGSAEASTSLENLRGIFSDTTTTTDSLTHVSNTSLNNPGDTVNSKVLDPYSAGGNLAINTGAKLTALTEASVVGDGVGDHFQGALEFLKGDEATAIADLGRAYGLVSDAIGGLQMEAAGRVDLNINSQANFTTQADAVGGHATAISELLSNNGAVNANLFAGDSGSINSNVDTIFKNTANAITGDTLAKGTAMNTVGIGASEFTFTGLGGLVNADANTNGLVKAVSTLGHASSELNSSTGGIMASTGESWKTITSAPLFQASMSGAEQINAIANNTGFAQAAAVAGSSGHNGVSATANQASIGVDGYHFSTSESLHLSSVNHVDSTAQAVFGTTSL
jgi:hypothetical protein